jgi:glycogen operon protein
MTSLVFAAGVPMIIAGDERGRTQGGNNNAFSQDDETSWVDWRVDDAWLDLYEITRAALRMRREHPALRQRHWFEGRPAVKGGPKDLAWIHPEGREMTGDDWHDASLRVIGMFVSGSPLRAPGPRGEIQRDASFLLWLNGSDSDCPCTLPANPWVPAGAVVLSTDRTLPTGTAVSAGDQLTVAARSLALLCGDG